jgi:hypothetical protein
VQIPHCFQAFLGVGYTPYIILQHFCIVRYDLVHARGEKENLRPVREGGGEEDSGLERRENKRVAETTQITHPGGRAYVI